jgi:hypothetical protein
VGDQARSWLKSDASCVARLQWCMRQENSPPRSQARHPHHPLQGVARAAAAPGVSPAVSVFGAAPAALCTLLAALRCGQGPEPGARSPTATENARSPTPTPTPTGVSCPAGGTGCCACRRKARAWRRQGGRRGRARGPGFAGRVQAADNKPTPPSSRGHHGGRERVPGAWGELCGCGRCEGFRPMQPKRSWARALWQHVLDPGLGFTASLLRRHPPAQGQLDHAAPVPVIASPGRQQQQQQLEDAAGGGAVMPAGSGEAEGRHASMAAHRYVMPMHAHWFGFNSIHNHERRALPELFNSCVPGFNISVRRGFTAAAGTGPEGWLTPCCGCMRPAPPPAAAPRLTHCDTPRPRRHTPRCATAWCPCTAASQSAGSRWRTRATP